MLKVVPLTVNSCGQNIPCHSYGPCSVVNDNDDECVLCYLRDQN